MDFVLQTILNNINQELICKIDYEDRKFATGKDAIENLKNEGKHYSLVNISAKHEMVVVSIRDATEELKKQDECFSETYLKQFGHVPSFFE